MAGRWTGYRGGVGGCDRNELREVSAAVLAVTSHLSVREVLQTILTSARRLLDARYAALGVPDENGSFAEFLADGVSDEQWRAIGPLPRQHGLLGVMLRDPTPVRLADIRTHPQFRWWPDAHPVLTDFLDFRTPQQRERACRREVELNSRLSPESYLGVAHLTDPAGGPAEPVVVHNAQAPTLPRAA